MPPAKGSWEESSCWLQPGSTSSRSATGMAQNKPLIAHPQRAAHRDPSFHALWRNFCPTVTALSPGHSAGGSGTALPAAGALVAKLCSQSWEGGGLLSTRKVREENQGSGGPDRGVVSTSGGPRRRPAGATARPPQRIPDALRGIPSHHQLPVPGQHHGALPAAGTRAPAGSPSVVRESPPSPAPGVGT